MKANNMWFLILIILAIFYFMPQPKLGLVASTQSACTNARENYISQNYECVGDCVLIDAGIQQCLEDADISGNYLNQWGFVYNRQLECGELTSYDLAMYQCLYHGTPPVDECDNDADCGPSTPIGDLTCYQGNVAQMYTLPICILPGNPDSLCDLQGVRYEVVQTCPGGCSQGECLTCPVIGDIPPCDGVVSREELGIAIMQWIAGDITRIDLGQIIVNWVSG